MSTQTDTCADLLEACAATYSAAKAAWRQYLTVSDEGLHPQLAADALDAYAAACRAERDACRAYDSTTMCHLHAA